MSNTSKVWSIHSNYLPGQVLNLKMKENWKSKKDSTSAVRKDSTNRKSIENGIFVNGTSFSPSQSSPLSDVTTSSSASHQEEKMLSDVALLNSMSIRYKKFQALLENNVIDLEQLRKLSWSGIPEEIRATVWKVLMGYLPTNTERRDATLERKRKEYEEFYAQTKSGGLDESLHHQIHIDILRTNSSIPLYQNTTIQECLERILYCWAIRHPASGYVQGINDLVIPFFQVFLSSYIDCQDVSNVSKLEQDTLTKVEADSFWCLTKLIDGIQDNYTFSQPGIQRQVARLKELVHRVDVTLSNHLAKEQVEFIQFAFRWMNCLLMREVSLKTTIRMWDTYMAEGSEGFSDFHLYVCAAFLCKFSQELKKKDFQEIMIFLQNIPTSNWGEKEVEILLSEGFYYKSLFHNSPSHLNKN
ncbi:GTPase-activating protein [Lobulomyces angularis]|nr:GTPase-activating protein [Lobulomyces angularis]